MPEKFLTATETAWKLSSAWPDRKYSLRGVQNLCAKSLIPCIKQGGEWRIPESELIRWMNEQRPQKRDVDYVY